MSPPEQAPQVRLPRRIHSRFISTEITRIRERANRSGEWTANKMGWSPSKQSRMEHGRIPIFGSELLPLLDLLGATDRERAAIVDAAVNGDPADPHAGAQSVLEWGTVIFPGSLQCPAYAWAVESTQSDQITRISPAAAEAAVDASLKWQRIALDGKLQISALFDEGCLQRQYGGTAAMENQMAYMGWLGSRPSVSVRMVPLSAQSVPPVGSFTYVQFPAERGLAGADLVLMRQLHGDGLVNTGDSTHLYHVAFGALTKAALSEARTRQAIERARLRWARRAA